MHRSSTDPSVPLPAPQRPIMSVPARLRMFLLGVDGLAAVLVALAFVLGRGERRDWLVAALLLVLALAFEESSNRVASLQWRFSSELKRDMTSVWAVAAAVALSPAAGVTLLVVVVTYVWWRQQRGTGQPLYRTWFTGSTGVLGCLAAGTAVRDVAATVPDLPWAFAGTVAVLLAIAIHTGINRALITAALIGVGVRGRALAGSFDDNLTEVATLCLGGLVALAAVHEPWLSVLVLVPLVMLQRGSFVRELEAAATTDSKTGLLNAIAWDEVAKREIARARRERYPLAVLIVDIDHFKLVNDRHGHLVGDQVLRGLGRSMSAAVREYDTIGRFGGEEFVVVLPDATQASALVVAERIRARANALQVSDLADGVAPGDRLAVSVGVAVFGDDGLELTDLLMAADRGLYLAKTSGRNQVAVHRAGPGEHRASTPNG